MLDLMDPPDAESIVAALKSLFLLGALSSAKVLTPLGQRMAALPLEPPLARALLAGAELGCARALLPILSILSSSALLFAPSASPSSEDARDTDARRKFRHLAGDHLTALNVWRAYGEVLRGEGRAGARAWCRGAGVNERCLAEARQIAAQLREVCTRIGVEVGAGAGADDDVDTDASADTAAEAEGVLRALVCGLVQNTAFLQPDGSYKQVMGPSVRLSALGMNGRPAADRAAARRSSKSTQAHLSQTRRCPRSCTMNWCVLPYLTLELR